MILLMGSRGIQKQELQMQCQRLKYDQETQKKAYETSMEIHEKRYEVRNRGMWRMASDLHVLLKQVIMGISNRHLKQAMCFYESKA